jgi:hypothetical protein
MEKQEKEEIGTLFGPVKFKKTFETCHLCGTEAMDELGFCHFCDRTLVFSLGETIIYQERGLIWMGNQDRLISFSPNTVVVTDRTFAMFAQFYNDLVFRIYDFYTQQEIVIHQHNLHEIDYFLDYGKHGRVKEFFTGFLC